MEDRGSVHLVQARERAAGVHPEIAGNFPLDGAVIEALPSGIRILTAESYGASAWSVTARINAEDTDGSPVGFFLKCTTEDSGRAQLHGEYTAMSALRDVVSAMIPRPIAWGKFHLESPPTYFFLADFKNMSDKLPDPARLGALVAELHQKSVSPTGKFGFGIQTYDGKLPHNVEWNSNWTEFFVELLTSAYDLDVRSNGVWPELADIFQRTIDSVIPRLLNALTANGRHIKPCLIHGDLWEGNIGTEYETEQIYIYDSAAYYAHNEMEIASWTCKHHKLRARAYKREYLRHFDASEPVDEWEDRSRLYGLKELFINSAHFPGTPVRERAFEEMCFLVEKYALSSEKNAVVAGGESTPQLPVVQESAIVTTGTTERVKTPTLNDDAVHDTDQAQIAYQEVGTTATAEVVHQPELSSLKRWPINLAAMPAEQPRKAGPAIDTENDVANHLSALHFASSTTPSVASGPGTTRQTDSSSGPSSSGPDTTVGTGDTGDTGLKSDDGSPKPSSSPLLHGAPSTSSAGLEKGQRSSCPDLPTFLAHAPP